MMDFIWIYIKGPSYFGKSGVFNELEYSIKSVRKNFKGDARCIVVGDDPGLDVIHVPCTAVESSKLGYYRHFDMLKKIQTALKTIKSKDFVMMYDDIFILNPISKQQLKKIYAKERIIDINEYMDRRKGDPSYKRCWASTYNRIAEFREDLWDFETHLPRYFKVNNLISIIERYRLEKVAYLVSSLYAAEYCEKPILITDKIQRNIIQDTPLHNEYDKDFNAMFLNVSDEGITQEFRSRMEELFGS